MLSIMLRVKWPRIGSKTPMLSCLALLVKPAFFPITAGDDVSAADEAMKEGEGYQEVPIDALRQFGQRLLAKAGLNEDDARLTTETLLAADLRGIESHGISVIGSVYVRRLVRGQINSRPDIQVVREDAAAATLEADGALGFVAAHKAMDLAMAKAKAAGVGLVTVRNSTHYGAGFAYALKAAREGMIGLSMTTGGNIVIPPGGKRRTYGANVISVAAPTGHGFEFVLDGSTSVVAAGKIHIAARQGTPIPKGWILDKDGNDTMDPQAFSQGGGLLPLGSWPELGAFKGFGLAIFADVMSGVLSGFGASLTITEPGRASHLLGAVNIEAFLPLAEFIRGMRRFIDGLKAAERQPGVDEILIPGEPEARREKERLARGSVPLHTSVLDEFRQVAAELDVPFALD